MMPEDVLLTTKETAMMLRVSPMTIRKLIREESLPAHRMGRKWVFIKSEILSWIKSR
jgi:excisionase family DNA binding protein